MPLIVEQFRIGGDRNFAYLAACQQSKEALVIDASFNPEMIVDYANQHDFAIRYVFSTHSHYDHTNGNNIIAQLTGVKPLLYGEHCERSGITVTDGARFLLGAFEATIIHTPGHTVDSFCVLIDNALFTGDTLFTGKIGGTATDDEAQAEYDSLWHKIMILPDTTQVYPGHDYGVASTSSIGQERRTNPFLLQATFQEFLDLKHNWAAYKKAHGIA